MSKSQFKPHALQYLRQVEQSDEELIITDYARPVVKIVPYHEDSQYTLKKLQGSIGHYEDPCKPVADDNQDSIK